MNNIDTVKNIEQVISLRQALKEARQTEQNTCCSQKFFDDFIKEVDKNEQLASTRIKRYIAKGSSAIVFETEDGNVLKLTKGNHFPMNRPVENFDVPIYKKGYAGKVRYYIEELLYQHGLSKGFVNIMKDMIKSKGYKINDLGSFDTFQIGLSKDGKLYLLDPECAKYKNIFQALWRKIKSCKILLKKV